MPSPPTLIVHERQPYWAPFLQRESSNTGEIVVRAVPHLIDLAEAASKAVSPLCLIVLDAQSPPGLISVLADLARRNVVLVATAKVPEITHWQLRELGVTSILESPIPVSQMVRTLRRQLQSGSVARQTVSATHH